MKRLWRAYNAHVLIISFLVGLFAMVLISLQQTLARAENSIKDSLSVVIFLQNDLPEAQASALTETIKSQDREIQSIVYTSKEQAYEEAIKDPTLSKSLMLLKTNPLPASFAVRYSDLAWWEREDPGQALRSLNGIQEIRWDPQARSLFVSVHRWRLWSLRFSAFAGIILLVWALIGLFRFFAQANMARELAVTLGIGAIGGVLAWGLWGIGLRSMQADMSVLRPVWVCLLPLVIGIVSALGCFGLDVRRVP